MYQVVMTHEGHRTLVFVGTEKAAQRKCVKLRAAETDLAVGYSVVVGSVTFSDPKTTRITNHN